MEEAPTRVGIAPSDYRLPPETRLGPVRLQVSDVERSIAFYADLIGLTLIGQTDRVAKMGVEGSSEPLVELVEKKGARPVPPRGALGLYHVAILLPDRKSLGRFIRHLAENDVRLGMADHLVSEAIYLNDPDGLGLEIYTDRPRETWGTTGREIQMATEHLDVQSLLEAAGPDAWTGMPTGTTIGHVHLHVGDIPSAADFYHEGLGFDKVVWSYPGALFMSAGGYHHHLGTNEWARHAPPASDDDARLLDWTIVVPTADDLTAVGANLERHGYGAATSGSAVQTVDPWGTGVRIVRDDV